MKRARIFFLLLTGASVMFFTSCRKDKEQATLDEQSITNEITSADADKSLEDIETSATLKSENTTGAGACSFQQQLPSCATVTSDSDTFPKNITIDFGTGCTDDHGRTRSGILHIHLTADMATEGAVRTVTFENFFCGQTQLTGSRTTTNTGLNSSGQPTYSRSIDVTHTRMGQSSHRVANGNVTWLSGYDTPACDDNVFQETGSGTCTRPNGTQITRTITTPLIIDHSCGYIISGVVSMTGPHGTGTMNFGNGTCDDQAVVTRPNGETQTITLHH